jgi:outer membrane autotransporter protein
MKQINTQKDKVFQRTVFHSLLASALTAAALPHAFAEDGSAAQKSGSYALARAASNIDIPGTRKSVELEAAGGNITLDFTGSPLIAHPSQGGNSASVDYDLVLVDSAEDKTGEYDLSLRAPAGDVVLIRVSSDSRGTDEHLIHQDGGAVLLLGQNVALTTVGRGLERSAYYQTAGTALIQATGGDITVRASEKDIENGNDGNWTVRLSAVNMVGVDADPAGSDDAFAAVSEGNLTIETQGGYRKAGTGTNSSEKYVYGIWMVQKTASGVSGSDQKSSLVLEANKKLTVSAASVEADRLAALYVDNPTADPDNTGAGARIAAQYSDYSAGEDTAAESHLVRYTTTGALTGGLGIEIGARAEDNVEQIYGAYVTSGGDYRFSSAAGQITFSAEVKDFTGFYSQKAEALHYDGRSLSLEAEAGDIRLSTAVGGQQKDESAMFVNVNGLLLEDVAETEWKAGGNIILSASVSGVLKSTLGYMELNYAVANVVPVLGSIIDGAKFDNVASSQWTAQNIQVTAAGNGSDVLSGMEFIGNNGTAAGGAENPGILFRASELFVVRSRSFNEDSDSYSATSAVYGLNIGEKSDVSDTTDLRVTAGGILISAAAEEAGMLQAVSVRGNSGAEFIVSDEGDADSSTLFRGIAVLAEAKVISDEYQKIDSAAYPRFTTNFSAVSLVDTASLKIDAADQSVSISAHAEKAYLTKSGQLLLSALQAKHSEGAAKDDSGTDALNSTALTVAGKDILISAAAGDAYSSSGSVGVNALYWNSQKTMQAETRGGSMVFSAAADRADSVAGINVLKGNVILTAGTAPADGQQNLTVEARAQEAKSLIGLAAEGTSSVSVTAEDAFSVSAVLADESANAGTVYGIAHTSEDAALFAVNAGSAEIAAAAAAADTVAAVLWQGQGSFRADSKDSLTLSSTADSAAVLSAAGFNGSLAEFSAVGNMTFRTAAKTAGIAAGIMAEGGAHVRAVSQDGSLLVENSISDLGAGSQSYIMGVYLAGEDAEMHLAAAESLSVFAQGGSSAAAGNISAAEESLAGSAIRLPQYGVRGVLATAGSAALAGGTVSIAAEADGISSEWINAVEWRSKESLTVTADREITLLASGRGEGSRVNALMESKGEVSLSGRSIEILAAGNGIGSVDAIHIESESRGEKPSVTLSAGSVALIAENHTGSAEVDSNRTHALHASNNSSVSIRADEVLIAASDDAGLSTGIYATALSGVFGDETEGSGREENSSEVNITAAGKLTLFGTLDSVIAGSRSRVNIDASAADQTTISGDILAVHGGAVTVKAGANAKIAGSVYAFSTDADSAESRTVSTAEISLGQGSVFTGHVDDFYALEEENRNDRLSGVYGDTVHGLDGLIPGEKQNSISSAGNITLTLKGATWNVTKDSWLTNLNAEAARIVFVGSDGNPENYHRLVVQNFHGNNNTFAMGINLGLDSDGVVANDQLHILSDNGGTYRVQIRLDGAGADGEKDFSANYLVRYQKSYETSGPVEGQQVPGAGFTIVSSGEPLAAAADVRASGVKLRLVSEEVAANGSANYYVLSYVDDPENLSVLNSRTEAVDTGEDGYWYLVRVDTQTASEKDPSEDTPEVRTMKDIGTSYGQYLGWRADISDLRSRLGNVRSGEESGVWVKGIYERERASALAYHAFKQTTRGVHIGADGKTAFASGSLLLGGSVRFAHTARKNHSAGNSGSGTMDQYSMKLYASYLAQSGFYGDLVLHSGLYDEEFKGRTNNGDYAADSKYWTRGGGASAEIGRRFSLENAGGAWFAEPQMQLSYYRIHGKNFTSTSGMRVSQSSVNSLVGRIGIFAGKDIAGNDGSGQIALKAGFNHEFKGRQTVRLNDNYRFNAKLGDTTFYYGLQAEWKVKENHRVFAGVERETGRNYRKDAAVQFTYRYSF